MAHLGVTPLVGQLVVDIGADYVGIRTVHGEVERFDALTVIRWSPLAPQPSPPPSTPTTGKTSGTPTETLARSVARNRLRAGRVPF
jgi:hypothetical protein